MQTKISQIATTQLNTLEQQAKETNGQFDLIKYFARPFPLAVICELLGLPEEDRHRILHWGIRFTNIKNSLDLLRAFPAIWKISHYFRKQFEHCKNHTSEGMISELVRTEQCGNELTEEELLATVFLLLLARHETTVHLIAAGTLALLRHPTQKKRSFKIGRGLAPRLTKCFATTVPCKPQNLAMWQTTWISMGTTCDEVIL